MVDVTQKMNGMGYEWNIFMVIHLWDICVRYENDPPDLLMEILWMVLCQVRSLETDLWKQISVQTCGNPAA